MRAAVIPAEEQQLDQALFIRNEFPVIDHPKDLFPAGPADSLHFLILQMQ
jgi:hypothetical protein